MHVLMTTDTLGGVFDYALALSSSLTARGAEVTLASMGRLPTEAQREAVVAAGAMLCESDYQLEWMDDPWAEVAAAGQWLLKLEQVFRPDVIHLNGYAHGALPWRAPVCMVAHSCVLSWWRAVHGESAPARYERYRAEVRRGLQAAAAVVAPTSAMGEMLQREHDRLPQLTVIHNGIADAPGGAPPEAAPSDAVPARDEGAAAPSSIRSVGVAKEPFVLAAGRLWDQAKNVQLLQQVAPLSRWPIRLAGDDSLHRAPHAPGLQGLTWLGFLPKAKLAEQMQRAAIFAAPALYEPFGLAILEAAAAGCALVLGDLPSLRELWNGAALFVDPRDPAALARALSQLSEAPVFREQLAERARLRARRYGTTRQSQAYLALYQSLLSQPPAHRDESAASRVALREPVAPASTSISQATGYRS